MNVHRLSLGRKDVKQLCIPIAPLVPSACATYHAEPLPQGPDLAPSPALTIQAQALALPRLQAHPFDAADGLDMTEVVTLAVVNNPDLKAKRLQARVAGGQGTTVTLLFPPDATVPVGSVSIDKSG